MAVAKKCKHCGEWIDHVEMTQCPVCGESIPVGRTICPCCKENIQKYLQLASKPTMQCPICKETIPADSHICPCCKEDIDDWIDCLTNQSKSKKNVHNDDTHVIQSKKSKKSESSKKERGIMISFIIVTILIIAGSLFAAFANKTPSSKKISDKDAVTKVVDLWTQCHNDKNSDRIMSTYGHMVKYYQSQYTRAQVVDSKKKLFNKHKFFYQIAEDVIVTFPSQDTAFVEFNKKVCTVPNSDDFDSYPSYLKLLKSDSYGGWRIIEESDYITDANLAKKKQR